MMNRMFFGLAIRVCSAHPVRMAENGVNGLSSLVFEEQGSDSGRPTEILIFDEA